MKMSHVLLHHEAHVVMVNFYVIINIKRKPSFESSIYSRDQTIGTPQFKKNLTQTLLWVLGNG